MLSCSKTPTLNASSSNIREECPSAITQEVHIVGEAETGPCPRDDADRDYCGDAGGRGLLGRPAREVLDDPSTPACVGSVA